MQWLRSLATPDAVVQLVRHAYGFDVSDCALVRSFVNDVYLVTTATGRYALKIYRHDGWSTDEVRWEQDLVGHAATVGVPVERPLPMVDGGLVGEVAYPEGNRPFALSAWVQGSKPTPPLSDDLYLQFGNVIGQFHAAGDAFSSPHPRRSFDMKRDLDDSAGDVVERLSGQPIDAHVVRELAAAAHDRLREFSSSALDWGVCHGDVSLDNILLTALGVVLHDFDSAREGWRVGDFTGVRTTPHWDAFVAGYTQKRQLRAADLDVVPWMQVVELIGNLHFHLVRKPLTRGTESLAEGWVDRELASLHGLQAQLLHQQ